jgi:GTPase
MSMTENEKLIITKYDLLYEQRMTRVESSIERLDKTTNDLMYEVKEIRKDMKSDFRWLLGMMLAIVGLMAKGFHWY